MSVHFLQCRRQINGLLQDCSNSSALAMELLQSCAKPSIYGASSYNHYSQTRIIWSWPVHSIAAADLMTQGARASAVIVFTLLPWPHFLCVDPMEHVAYRMLREWLLLYTRVLASSLSHISFQWRHNERDGVSNYQRLDCLLSRLFNADKKIRVITFPAAWKR